MPTIIQTLDSAFRSAIMASFNVDADPLISPSANPQFGDYQSNAAMGLSKTLAAQGNKTNPRAVAEKIKTNLNLGNLASEISIAGPGFINVKLNPDWLAQQLLEAVSDRRIGIEKVQNPQTIVIDYSGPNVAKELHVGHLRSTIIGDAVARILEFQGHRIIRQNHIGDWGTQFGMLITFTESINPNECPAIDDLEDFYRKAKQKFDSDPEFQNKARQTVVKLQAHQPHEYQRWQAIVAETRKHYLPIYQRLGVQLTVSDERGESFYNPYLADVVTDLLLMEIAELSDGAIVVFTDGKEASPLIIRKKEGGFLYGTTDLAAIRFRISELNANRVIYLTDSRQCQHFHQIFTTAKLAKWDNGVSLEHAPFGTMLGEDGKPFKTRTGGVVKLKDLLDESEERAMKLVADKNPELPEDQKKAIAHSVGIGAVKYSDLSKDRTSDYVFAWDRALAMDGNTAPYLQYAYARIRSIFRKSNEKPDLSQLKLEDQYEIALAKQILRLGEILILISRELKPHHLCSYLYELSVRFSSFYENCPVLSSQEPTRSSRLTLCQLTANTLQLGLDLLGIEHPQQM